MPITTPKPRYDILDGLRGVAALLVILYHVFECFSWSPAPHGYLAVDFFFVLSGFVIGYAYDSRWQEGLGVMTFFRRRLIRLHPMVVVGVLLGAICFLLQGSVRWDGSHVATSMVMIALLLNMFMLPLPPGSGADVRGNGELFPLNGPHWSLFFEYIGNVLYALLLRRLSTRALATVAAISGAALVGISLHDGYLGVGWTMANGGLMAGLVRMLFPYATGMLLARISADRSKKHIGQHHAHRHVFLYCALVLAIVACIPALDSERWSWLSSLYDVFCVIFVFPSVVWMGASAAPAGKWVKALGELSYPLYAIHYPLMYLFYAHIGYHGDLVPIERLQSTWPAAIAVALGSVVLAWFLLTFYDRPVRKKLTSAFS